MKILQWTWCGALALALLSTSAERLSAVDVTGYSVLKGQFLNQTDPDTLVTDPDFGFSLLVSVTLADFGLVTNATVTLPDGSPVDLDDLGDEWDHLDSFATLDELNQTDGWGNLHRWLQHGQ
jgi:hypothetical protein